MVALQGGEGRQWRLREKKNRGSTTITTNSSNSNSRVLRQHRKLCSTPSVSLGGKGAGAEGACLRETASAAAHHPRGPMGAGRKARDSQ